MKSLLSVLSDIGRVDVVPATAERWSDLEPLFAQRGPTQGCWCMFWRYTRAEWSSNFGPGNKAALKTLMDNAEVPGLLAYTGKQAVGWCSVAPRATFGSLERSRVLKAVDDQPVWAVVCLFVAKPFRRHGVSVALLQGAIEYVRTQGGRLVEIYPHLIEHDVPEADIYMGISHVCADLGFVEVARPRPDRLIMRYTISADSAAQ